MNAKDYKKLASAKRVDAEVFEVTLPSTGAVWKLREPPIQKFVLSGKLPASLASKMAAAAKNGNGDSKKTEQEVLESLSPEDLMLCLALGRDLLLHCAVEPRIVIDADPESETEISPEDIDPDDFTFLMSWVFSGGKSGENLTAFRSE